MTVNPMLEVQVNIPRGKNVIVHLRDGRPSFIDKFKKVHNDFLIFSHHKKVRKDQILTVVEFKRGQL